MDLVDFVAAYVNRFVTAPGGIGGECVDLCNQYLVDVLHRPEVHANAVNWPDVARPGLRWVPNTPTNFPMPGAIVVWHENAVVGTGPNGHIAVVIRASAMALVTFDQNWPDGSPAVLRVHNYRGIVGWFTAG